MISQDAINWITKKEKAINEIEALLKAIAQKVEELDKEALLAPAEIEEENGRAYWEFLKEESKNEPGLDLGEEHKEEEEDFEDHTDDEDDWDEEEEEEEEEEEDRDKEITIGIYLWPPEPDKAVLSIYLEYFGSGDYDENWRTLKQLKSKLGGKIHLYHDEWGEEKVEVERIPLEEMVQGKINPEDVARKIYEIAKKAYTFIED